MGSWRIQPEPIPENLIKETYSADVIVVGLGYSGTAAFRAATESGASVIGITYERRREDFVAAGAEVGHINSKLLETKGVPKVDPIDFFNEMMKRSANRGNQELVMKFSQNCGKNMDWWLDVYPLEAYKDIMVRYWDKSNKYFKELALAGKGEINGYHFWYGTLWFPYNGGNFTGHPNCNEVVLANQDKAVAMGARRFWGIEAVNIEMDGKRIGAIIGKDREGNYYRFKSNKSVIMSTAGCEHNKEMRSDLLTVLKDLMTPDESFDGIDRPGAGFGIKAGVWAGGRTEAGSLASTLADAFFLRGLNEAFGELWLDPYGKRFCNEILGGTELAGMAGNQIKRGVFYNIFDENVLDYELWSPPMHYGFDFYEDEDVNALKDLICYAKAHPEEGHCVVRNKFKLKTVSPFGTFKDLVEPVDYHKQLVYYGRTPEELVKNSGLAEDLAKNIVESIKRYNQMCEQKRDDDFGKDSKVLKKLDGILFMEGRQKKFGGHDIGFICGGLATDGNCNVLDEYYNPIPGLYAAGNCCGRRFGLQYTTPIAGLSLGMSIVLGREAGLSAAR